jgi:hypothetical protein
MNSVHFNRFAAASPAAPRVLPDLNQLSQTLSQLPPSVTERKAADPNPTPLQEMVKQGQIKPGSLIQEYRQPYFPGDIVPFNGNMSFVVGSSAKGLYTLPINFTPYQPEPLPPMPIHEPKPSQFTVAG